MHPASLSDGIPSNQILALQKLRDWYHGNEQTEIITCQQDRAHRAAQENVKQVLQDYYFPNMSKLANEDVINCKTCTKANNNGQTKKQGLGVTKIASYADEMLHMDIYLLHG